MLCTYSLAGSLCEKNNWCSCDSVLDRGQWMIPNSGIIMNSQWEWIISNTKPKDVIPDSSIWFSSYLPQQPATTTLAPDLNQVALLQIFVPGSETLPTSANVCFTQPLLSKPLLVAVDIHLQSGEGAKDGQARFPSFCDVVSFCYHVIFVSDILLIRSVQSLPINCLRQVEAQSSHVTVLVHTTPTFTSSQVCISATKISGNLFGSNGIQYQKTILRSFRNIYLILNILRDLDS